MKVDGSENYVAVQSSNSLPHLRSVVDRLASNLMIYAVRMLKYVVLSVILMEFGIV